MKKIISVLLALVMTLALSVSALAAGEGSITVDNAVNGKTYTIYRIFDLNSHSEDYKAINYKVSEKWKGFFEANAEGLKYVDIDGQGYVTWKKNASAADFAAEAIKFAKANSIVNDGDAVAANGKVEFKNLTLGYYLVQSDLGALCSLDTTMPNVTIEEKNGVPTVDKKVKEGEAWGKTNDANIGDTVNFQTTINVIDGQPKNYVLHDKMSAGLTFDASSVKVTVNGAAFAAENYILVTTGLTDGCTFEIRFTDGTLKANDVVKVTYSAILNEKAVIAGVGNPNETQLTYGNNAHTEWDKTTTYTYKFDLVKTKADNTLLTGAEFKLYDAKTGGNEIALVKEADGTYRVATGAEKNAEGFQSATIEAGSVTIKGLDSGTYYLEEIKAPAGYNVLAERVEVKIDGANLDATMNGDSWSSGGVHVINQSGTELPSTGGMGTTIFYVLGGVLMAGAFVLLVVRKRMRAE